MKRSLIVVATLIVFIVGASAWYLHSKQPVRNQDLWHELIAAALHHEIEWVWVKGHSGHIENERVDKLASDAAESQF